VRRVVGIDLSLASTGLADNQGRTERVRTKPGGKELTRIRRIVRASMIFADLPNWAPYGGPGATDLAVVEGPAFSRGAMGGQHLRAGLHWLLLDALDGNLVPVLIVPPNVRTMYATGKGNSSKDEVLACVIKRYPAWEVTGNDIADAVVLAAIGARLLGDPVEESLPQANLRAMTKVAL